VNTITQAQEKQLQTDGLKDFEGFFNISYGTNARLEEYEVEGLIDYLLEALTVYGVSDFIITHKQEKVNEY
jgi:hypothetical protein